MRGNLLRYATWQFRDFARDRGITVLIIGLAFGVTFITPMKAMDVQFTENSARQLIVAILAQLAFLAAFLSFNGMISNDRKLGYFRFLFAKPVGISAYYAQMFVLFFVGYVAAFSILLSLFAAAVFPVFPLGALAYSALVFLSLGGIAFLISSLFRHDWPILAGIFVGTTLLRSLLADHDGMAQVLLAVLPPFHKLTSSLTLVNGQMPEIGAIVWLLGYSALFFVAGLMVLRRRPAG